MARIEGIDLPNQKRVVIGLTYIYGIGTKSANDIVTKAGIPLSKRVHELTEDEIGNEAFVRGIAKFTGNRDMIVTEDEWNLKQKEVMGPNSLFALKIAPNGEARELWRYEKGFNGIIPSPLSRSSGRRRRDCRPE